MPNRVIRESILDSERYLDLPSDTHRIAFLHIILLADDLGNLEAGAGYIRRRALPNVTPSAVPAILAALADVDLIRMYEHDGKTYAHIPRFRQKLRFLTTKVPRPPSSVECKEISQAIARTDVSEGAWQKIRKEIITRDGGCCQRCGTTERLSVDHLLPISEGGRSVPENLVTLCVPCNSWKKGAGRDAELRQILIGKGYEFNDIGFITYYASSTRVVRE